VEEDISCNYAVDQAPSGLGFVASVEIVDRAGTIVHRWRGKYPRPSRPTALDEAIAHVNAWVSVERNSRHEESVRVSAKTTCDL
jgi:hypothetical protein